MLYVYVALILISETAAITFLKKFSLNQGFRYFGLGLVCYSLVAFFLARSFAYEDIGIVNALWSAFSILLVLLVGVFYFREQISQLELWGIILIMSGILLVRLKGA